jgi:hypothetical protein
MEEISDYWHPVATRNVNKGWYVSSILRFRKPSKCYDRAPRVSNDEPYYISVVDFQVVHNNLNVFKVVCQITYSPDTAGFMIASGGTSKRQVSFQKKNMALYLKSKRNESNGKLSASFF